MLHIRNFGDRPPPLAPPHKGEGELPRASQSKIVGDLCNKRSEVPLPLVGLGVGVTSYAIGPAGVRMGARLADELSSPTERGRRAIFHLTRTLTRSQPHDCLGAGGEDFAVGFVEGIRGGDDPVARWVGVVARSERRARSRAWSSTLRRCGPVLRGPVHGVR